MVDTSRRPGQESSQPWYPVRFVVGCRLVRVDETASAFRLPLPQEIPTAFKMLPEYFIEDIVDYYLFLVM